MSRKKLSQTTLKKMELDALYESWTGEEAKKIEAEGSEFHMVIVTRYVRVAGKVHARRSEYPFSTEEIARRCKAYWMKRGGLVNLLLVKVLEDWGFTDEPDLFGGP